MKYFAIINKEQVGPMELPELVEAGLMPDSYVWCKGMDDWQQAREVADICRYFRNRIFDLMHPSAPPATPDAGQSATPNTPDDTDYKSMKSREFWATVATQIREQTEQQEERPASSATPPSTWYPFPIILAVIFFFPLGVPALLYARKSAKLWKAGQHEESHEAARQAKFYGGIAFFIGLIFTAAIFRFII